jgi:hypothetical protein
MCDLRLPPIFAVSELAVFLHAMCDVPLLPHPVEAAVEPAAHSSMRYASVASTTHHAVEQHLSQPVDQCVVVAVQIEVEVEMEGVEEEEEMEKEDEQAEHIE